MSGHDPATARVTTLGEEKRINTFLRLTSPSVIAKLREEFPDLPERPDAKTVFVKLQRAAQPLVAGASARPPGRPILQASAKVRASANAAGIMPMCPPP